MSETINHVLPMTTCKLSHVIRKLSKKWDLLEVPEASPKKKHHTLWLFNGLPWKIRPFLRAVHHPFLSFFTIYFYGPWLP